MKSARNLNVSNPKVLVGLAVFLVLIGGMITDPLAGLACLVLAGIIAGAASIRGERWTRWFALCLIVIIAALAVQTFPEARRHGDLLRRK